MHMDVMTAPRPKAVRPRLTLWLLRLIVSVQLAGAIAQPVLAGRVLTGDVDALALHSQLGGSLAFVDLILIAATLPYAWVARPDRLWTVPLAVAMFVAVIVQVSAGRSRRLGLHIPLGVAIVTVSVVLAIWVWSPAAGRPRRAR